jgi:hypothetical protein
MTQACEICGSLTTAQRVPSSIVEITLSRKLLKTKGRIVWLGVRDDFRNWLIRAA